MVNRRATNVQQPLSGRDSALVAATLVILGTAMLLAFVFLAPRLIPANLINQFFYIVLIIWGLVCAVVCFGVLAGYAHLRYRNVGLGIELGGPSVIALLVVIGGFWLVPHTDTFDLTIRPHGEDEPIVKNGSIRVEFGNNAPTELLRENGEVDFKGIPARYRGATVRVLPLVMGYKEEYQDIVISGDAIDLELTKENPQTQFVGKIVPLPKPKADTKIFFEGEQGFATPDRFGNFEFTVHRKINDQIRVDVCENGRRVYDGLEILTKNDVQLHTRKPDVPCSS